MDLIERCINGEPSVSEGEELFAAMLDGKVLPNQIAAYLAIFRMRPVTGDLLLAAAKAMGSRSFHHPLSSSCSHWKLADNCGTGGDGKHTFNISTATAVIAASCGIKLAKHGNRSVSSRCGSADLLFAAGFPESLTPIAATALLEETGLTFFFAPSFHPGMRHIMPVRKELGIKTVFNLLGPLANPLRPHFQVIGVANVGELIPMAQALQGLGVEKGLVVHSRDGLDELSHGDLNDCILVGPDILKEIIIDPKEFGMSGKFSDVAGGDPSENLAKFRGLLAGQEPGLASCISLNCGALLFLTGLCPSIDEGITLARKALSEGRAEKFFEKWLLAADGKVAS